MVDRVHEWLTSPSQWSYRTALAVVMWAGYMVSQYNYPLFHTVVELSTCIVGCAIFMLFWNARRHLDHGFFLLLGTACLAATVFDFVHVLTSGEMHVIPGTGVDESLLAKIIGRWIAAISFLIAPLFLRRRCDPLVLLGAYGLAVVLGLAAVFWHLLPSCYLTVPGMTTFERLSRGLTGMVFLAAAAGVARRRARFAAGLAGLLCASLLASAASEFASGLSTDMVGLTKVFAHLAQLVSTVWLYKALIEMALMKPHDVLLESLQHSEARLKSIVSNASEIIYTLSPEGIVTFTSPVWTNKLGWEVEAIQGRSLVPFLHPDDVELCHRAIAAALNSGEAQRGLEYRILHQDGAWRWHKSAISPVRDDAGKPSYLVGIAEDITQRKSADAAGARSLARLEGVNRLQEELILPAPLEAKFKKVTDTAVELLDLDFCRIWSMRPGDLCDSGCTNAAAACDGLPICRRHDKCLHLAASSGRYTHTDGDHRRVPLGYHKVGLIATGDEKKVVSNSVTTDPQVAQHGWAEQLGLVSFAGYKLHDVRGDTTGVLAMFARHPLSDEDDAFLSHLAETTSRVIIEHRAGEELRQAQKLEGVGQLAGGVAHEFNNLLQAIGGYASYAMEGLNPQEERYSDLEQVIKASERATSLTRQLLGFSRRRVLQPKSNDANVLVQDLVKLVRPAIGEHISLELALGDDTGAVFADAGELQQALLNLCVNARDAMPTGGTLLLKTERVTLAAPCWDPQFEIEGGQYVVFSVSDTGCGIPRDLQQRVFEPFFTTKEVGKGTGLGLALVYGVVRQHKGAIHLYSELGLGTTFKLYLPVSNGEAANRDREERDFGPLGQETILVAEDDPMVRNLSIRTLERAGYRVLAAADGQEALEIFEKHRDMISLVLLDAIMPKLSGHEVHRRIRGVSPETPTVCCTGYDRETARSECLVRENVPLIQKPFDTQTLLSVVREALDGKATCRLTPQLTA